MHLIDDLQVCLSRAIVATAFILQNLEVHVRDAKFDALLARDADKTSVSLPLLDLTDLILVLDQNLGELCVLMLLIYNDRTKSRTWPSLVRWASLTHPQIRLVTNNELGRH